jgi:hypothetical protein
MVDERFFYATLGRPFFECEAWRLGVLEYLTTLRPDVVITGSGASYAIAPQAWHEGSQRVLNVIAANAGRVVVLQPNPVLAENPLRCLAREAWRQRLGWPDDVCHLKPSLAATRDERDSADRLAAEIPGVRVLDLSDLICAGEQCPAVRDHTVVYRDTQHLTARFVKRIAAEVGERLKALLVALPEAAPELEATTDAAPSGGT